MLTEMAMRPSFKGMICAAIPIFSVPGRPSPRRVGAELYAPRGICLDAILAARAQAAME